VSGRAPLEARDLVCGGFDMSRASFPRGSILVFSLVAFAFGLALPGCSDDSKTSGTMVQVSEETQAHRKARAETYKGGPPKAKAKGKSAKKS
jgi:hypothetical protein